jgi:hypothetical protein
MTYADAPGHRTHYPAAGRTGHAEAASVPPLRRTRQKRPCAFCGAVPPLP